MSNELSLITPLTITAGMITSSTAVTHVAAELEWNAATNYAKGQVVFRATWGRRYENLVPGVHADNPEDNPERWYDLGPTDTMAMFDTEVSTQSIADNTLTVVFAPGAFDAMFLAGLDGASLSVTVKALAGGSVIYSVTEPLEASEPADYWEYFFDPFQPKSTFYASGLDPYAGCEVTLTVSNPAGIARCGMASLGALTKLGKSLSGVTISPKSYARVTVDERGATKIKKGKSAQDMTISATVPLDDLTRVHDNLTRVMGVPCVWIGSDSKRLSSMRVFGLGNGKLTEQGSHAMLNLTVEGMI